MLCSQRGPLQLAEQSKLCPTVAVCSSTAAAGQPQLGQQALPAAANVDLQAAAEDMAAAGLESGHELDQGLGEMEARVLSQLLM